MNKSPSENLRSFSGLLGLPVLKEAYEKWLVGLSYNEMIHLARFYESDVDELVLKLFRISDEARCQQLLHTIFLNTPGIVLALLYERFTTTIGLFESLEQNPDFNATSYGQSLFGMLSLYHQLLCSSGKP